MARGGSSTVAADQASNRLLTQRFRVDTLPPRALEPIGLAIWGPIAVAIGIEAALWVAAAVL
jgi:hypothetical protein